ncbi:MAG: type III secretion system chaperone [Candidatus Protochlamydia sp.]|nr:type III secretion system chaperone [Candidatus Protochlamydia sp.]
MRSDSDTPQENTHLFLSKAMQSNLFGHGTRGAAIGLDNEGKILTLSLEIDSDSNYKEFHERLEDFISILDFWRKEASKQK